MAQFFSEENLKLIVTIAKKYMIDKFSFEIEDEKQLKKLAYEVMGSVDSECRGANVPLEKRNVAVLNAIREYYIKKFGLTNARKPNVQSLTRDRDVFGNRPVNATNIVPSVDPYQRKAVEFDISRIIESRDEQIGLAAKKPAVEPLASTKETAEDNDAFMRRFREFEDARRDLERTFESQQQLHRNDAPAAPMLRTAPSPPAAPAALAKVVSIGTTKHATISSQDRSWTSEHSPYDWTAALGGAHLGVESISVCDAVFPASAVEWPYVLLCIKEFSDVCDGTNDSIRGSFCKLTLDKMVECGGRRYAIMASDGIERKARAEELSRISVRVLTPLGSPLPMAGGEPNAVRSATVEGSRVKIAISGPGDYRPGDVVLLRGVEADKRSFGEFLTRGEGHRIVDACDGAFYVDAPLDGSRDGSATRGYAMNAMLQASISLSIECSGEV